MAAMMISSDWIDDIDQGVSRSLKSDCLDDIDQGVSRSLALPVGGRGVSGGRGGFSGGRGGRGPVGPQGSSPPRKKCRSVTKSIPSAATASDSDEAEEDDAADEKAPPLTATVSLASLLQLQEADGSWASAPSLWSMLPPPLNATFETFKSTYGQWLGSSADVGRYVATQLARVLLRLLFGAQRAQWRFADAKAARWQKKTPIDPPSTPNTSSLAAAALHAAFPITA
jgi:hypothetical protein